MTFEDEAGGMKMERGEKTDAYHNPWSADENTVALVWLENKDEP